MDLGSDIQAHSRDLEHPVSIDDLIHKGAVMSFKPSEDNIDETFDPENEFDINQLQKFVKLDLCGGSILDNYKKDMISIPCGSKNDGKLLKKIKVEGHGDIVPEGAFVFVHYVYYSDMNEVPIDISYLRSVNPEQFQLGHSGLIPAVEYAISSMKKGEKADFYAHYDLCFGKLGCVPRIPAEADLLFEIELINFSMVGQKGVIDEEVVDGEIVSCEQSVKDPPFKKVLQEAEKYASYGKSNFNCEQYSGAIKSYGHARNILLNVRLNNDEEQMQMEKMLCQTYVNLMVSHNKLNQFKATCDCANKALQYAHTFADKNSKLWFHWGKALNGLQEWGKGISKLKRAKSLVDGSKDKQKIDVEISNAMIKYNKHKSQFQNSCKKMFSPSYPSSDQHDNRGVVITEINDEEETDSSEMYRLIELKLGEFKMADNIYTLPMGSVDEFSSEDIKVFRQFANKMNLICSINDGEVVFIKEI